MMRYSVQPKDQIFVKGYEFLSFAIKMGKNIGKDWSKNLSDKYDQKLLDHAKQSVTDAIRTSSKRVIQKTAEGTGDFIDNKIDNRVTKVSKNSKQNNSETVTNDHDKEISKERYIFPKEIQETIDELRLK